VVVWLSCYITAHHPNAQRLPRKVSASLSPQSVSGTHSLLVFTLVHSHSHTFCNLLKTHYFEQPSIPLAAHRSASDLAFLLIYLLSYLLNKAALHPAGLVLRLVTVHG